MADYNLHELLIANGLTCAVAESCTGGLLAAALTEQPGSSSYMLGGVITYTREIKKHILGVPLAISASNEAVNSETASAMLQGVLDLFGADVGIATTGFAGPGGGTVEEPVGTVYIAYGSKEHHQVERCHWDGDRSTIRRCATRKGIELLTNILTEGGIICRES